MIAVQSKGFPLAGSPLISLPEVTVTTRHAGVRSSFSLLIMPVGTNLSPSSADGNHLITLLVLSLSTELITEGQMKRLAGLLSIVMVQGLPNLTKPHLDNLTKPYSWNLSKPDIAERKTASYMRGYAVCSALSFETSTSGALPGTSDHFRSGNEREAIEFTEFVKIGFLFKRITEARLNEIHVKPDASVTYENLAGHRVTVRSAIHRQCVRYSPAAFNNSSIKYGVEASATSSTTPIASLYFNSFVPINVSNGEIVNFCKLPFQITPAFGDSCCKKESSSPFKVPDYWKSDVYEAIGIKKHPYSDGFYVWRLKFDVVTAESTSDHFICLGLIVSHVFTLLFNKGDRQRTSNYVPLEMYIYSNQSLSFVILSDSLRPSLCCRRFISPLAAVTKNPAVLSPDSRRCSISSITSCGIRIVVICDLAFFAPVAITESPYVWCISVYAKEIRRKVLRCISLWASFKNEGDIHLLSARPGSVLSTARTSDHKPLVGVTIMAEQQHTQTRPLYPNKFSFQHFTWCFLALGVSGCRVIHINATTEFEARKQSPAGCVMVFAARLPAEGMAKITIPSGLRESLTPSDTAVQEARP